MVPTACLRTDHRTFARQSWPVHNIGADAARRLCRAEAADGRAIAARWFDCEPIRPHSRRIAVFAPIAKYREVTLGQLHYVLVMFHTDPAGYYRQTPSEQRLIVLTASHSIWFGSGLRRRRTSYRRRKCRIPVTREMNDGCRRLNGHAVYPREVTKRARRIGVTMPSRVTSDVHNCL